MFHFIAIIPLFISFYRNYPEILFHYIILCYQSRREALFSAGKCRSPILSFLAIRQTLQIYLHTHKIPSDFIPLHYILLSISPRSSFFKEKWRSPIMSLLIIPQTLQNTQGFYSITLYYAINLAAKPYFPQENGGALSYPF